MFYEPKTLIIVYKDEMLANQMKKLIETKDDKDGSVIGTTDNSINVVAWTEKVWLSNKEAGNINSKVLFLGNIKGVDKLIPVLDVQFDAHGVRYGWAGNQAAIYVTPKEIKSIEAYHEFYEELVALPAPQAVKDAIKPKVTLLKNATEHEDKQYNETIQGKEGTGFLDRGKRLAKKLGDSIGDVVAEVSARALIFSEENFKDKKVMECQMLFYGVIKMYNDGLETFMKS